MLPLPSACNLDRNAKGWGNEAERLRGSGGGEDKHTVAPEIFDLS